MFVQYNPIDLLLCICTLANLLILYLGANVGQPANILLLVADSLGFNDVSWHNSRVATPNLEQLGRAGVILDNYYTTPR